MPSFSSSSLRNTFSQRIGSNVFSRMLAPLLQSSQLIHQATTFSISTLLILTSLPFLLATILFLIPLAFLTTCFAISAIVSRTLFIYVDLFASLFRYCAPRLSELSTTISDTPLRSEKASPIRASPPRIISYPSSPRSSRDTTFRKDLEPSRDFEGLGGWCYPTWTDSSTTLYSRRGSQASSLSPVLELPVSNYAHSRVEEGKHKRIHMRSLTTGSLGLSKVATKPCLNGTRSNPESGPPSPRVAMEPMRRPKSLMMTIDGTPHTGRRRSGHGSWDKPTNGLTRDILCV